MNNMQAFMGSEGVGFFGMLLIGFIAGYIAERLMERDHGLLTNIFVGIAGSFVGGTLARVLGISFYGFLGNLVIATLGAILILWFFGRNKGRDGGSSSDQFRDRDGNHDPMYHSRSKDQD